MPTFRSSVTSTVSSVSSRSLTYGTAGNAPASGDIALFFLEVDNGAAVTAPTGWAPVPAETTSGISTSDGVGTHVYYHVCDGTEGGTSTGNFTFSANFSQCALGVWTSTNGTTPWDVNEVTSSLASSTSYTVPSITTATGGDLVLASCIETDVTQSAHAMPAGWTKRIDLTSIAVFDQTFASAGATGTSTITVTGSAATTIARAMALAPGVVVVVPPPPFIPHRMPLGV